MVSIRVAVAVAVLAVMSNVSAIPAAPAVAPEAVAAGDVPPGYAFCTERPTYMACYNLCGGAYWFIAPKCCCQ
ncbi:hypothetical protein BGZ54_009318 [Gamsiella multidivaricata]|nr:hypothetical protein BGZ54_009318 [Gamsiella multidivaricata]